MSLRSDYGVAMRTQLGRYAVWEPAENIQLGDYGIIQERTFKKLGNITTDFAI